MRISKRKFDFLVNNKDLSWRLIKLKDDKYIYIFSLEIILKNIAVFLRSVIDLPIGIACSILSSIWDFCTLALPEYIKDLYHSIVNLFPIKVLTVVDDDCVESIR